MKLIRTAWGRWQIITFSALYAVLESVDEPKPPDKVLTPAGVAALVSIVTLIFTVAVPVALASRIFNTRDIDLTDLIPNSIDEWMDKYGTSVYNMTYYEKYVFYKYFLKTARWLNKKEFTSYKHGLLDSVDGQKTESYRNHMISKVLGL